MGYAHVCPCALVGGVCGRRGMRMCGCRTHAAANKAAAAQGDDSCGDGTERALPYVCGTHPSAAPAHTLRSVRRRVVWAVALAATAILACDIDGRDGHTPRPHRATKAAHTMANATA